MLTEYIVRNLSRLQTVAPVHRREIVSLCCQMCRTAAVRKQPQHKAKIRQLCTFAPVSLDTKTFLLFSVCKSYTEMVPLSERSATARNFLLGEIAKAVMPSLSGEPGVNRCTFVSTL